LAGLIMFKKRFVYGDNHEIDCILLIYLP